MLSTAPRSLTDLSWQDPPDGRPLTVGPPYGGTPPRQPPHGVTPPQQDSPHSGTLHRVTPTTAAPPTMAGPCPHSGPES